MKLGKQCIKYKLNNIKYNLSRFLHKLFKGKKQM